MRGPGGAWSRRGGLHDRGGAWWRPPSPTATAAGGMHPTGMHSCFYCSQTNRGSRRVQMVTALVNKYFSEILSQLTVVDSRFPIEDETLYSFNCSRPQTKFGARQYFHRCLSVHRGRRSLSGRPPWTETSPWTDTLHGQRPPTVKLGKSWEKLVLYRGVHGGW